MIKNKYPVKAIMHNGKRINLYNRRSLLTFAKIEKETILNYDMNSYTWTIFYSRNKTKKIREVIMKGSINNGDIVSVFIDNVYHRLPIKGKIVIDVGANIGDSSIYFALNGAYKVIAIEPYYKNFQLAKENIELNNLSTKIKLILAACTIKNGLFQIDPYFQGIGGCITSHSTKKENNGDKTIPLITLEDIIKNIKDASKEFILKMDCEGCEYDVILSASENTLRQFRYIQIEYHYGYKNLREKLKKCGFNVSVTKPIAHYRTERIGAIDNRWMYLGYIFAERY